MIELPKEACWNSDDVAAVISNEALEGHEGIFLATHTPIRDFEVTGSHAGEIDGRDEQAVILALSDPSRSHDFFVVQGAPGSGKSHLIRSEERRIGKECVRTCGSRWWQSHDEKKQ